MTNRGSAGVRRCPEFIGRIQQRQALSGALSRLAEGRGEGVLVLGEAGIGKSRLIEWFADEAAERGHPVLTGRAWDAALPTAMAPIQEALLQCQPLLEFAATDDAGELAPFVGHLLPVQRARAAPEPTPTLVAHSTLSALDLVAPGSVVVIEDLHAADHETVAAVRYMLARSSGSRVLVVATARPAELDVAWWQVAETVSLGRLAPDEVMALAAAQLGCSRRDLDVDVTDRVELADGLPLLVEDLIADTLDTGNLSDPLSVITPSASWPGASERFSQLVLGRLHSLDDDVRAVAHAAAVLGPTLELGLLSDAVELEGREMQAALAAAANAQLLATDGSRFRHALTRDVVLASTPRSTQVAVARRVAASLVDPPHRLSNECAGLLALAGRPKQAATLLLRSARTERRMGANASAAAMLERARDLSTGDEPFGEVTILLTETLVDLGRAHDAELVAAAGRATLSLDERVEASLLLASGAATAFDPDLLDRHLSAATSAMQPDDPRWARAAVLEALRTLQFADDPDRRVQAESLARAAVATANEVEDRVALCDAWMVVGRCARFRDLDEGASAYERAFDIATLDGLRGRRLNALHELGTIDLLTWRGPRRLELARDEATSAGALGTLCGVLLNLAGAYLIAADWARAEMVAVEAQRIADELGAEHASAIAQVWEASAIGFAGDVSQANSLLDTVLDSQPADPNLAMAVDIHARMGFALVEEDLDAVLRLAAIDRPQTEMMDYGPGWTLLLGAKRGELDADHVRNAVSGLAGRSRPTALKCLDQCALAIAIGPTDPKGANVLGDAVLDHVETTGLAGIMLRHVAEAALDGGWGDPQRWLSAVHRRNATVGDHSEFAAATRRLLSRAGVALPRRTARSAKVPPELFARGVTPREFDVLGRMAEHPTNAELAATLHLSVRTIEKHVSSLLTKLAVPSRRDLGLLAAEHGWADSEIGGSPPMTRIDDSRIMR